MDSKSWWMSRAVWGGIVAVLAGIAGAGGYVLSPEDQDQFVNLAVPVASAVGGVVAIIGRVLASKRVGGHDA